MCCPRKATRSRLLSSMQNHWGMSTFNQSHIFCAISRVFFLINYHSRQKTHASTSSGSRFHWPRSERLLKRLLPIRVSWFESKIVVCSRSWSKSLLVLLPRWFFVLPFRCQDHLWIQRLVVDFTTEQPKIMFLRDVVSSGRSWVLFCLRICLCYLNSIRNII